MQLPKGQTLGWYLHHSFCVYVVEQPGQIAFPSDRWIWCLLGAEVWLRLNHTRPLTVPLGIFRERRDSSATTVALGYTVACLFPSFG